MTGEHWEQVWRTKADDAMSWFQRAPVASLQAIESAAPAPARVLDVGGGASRLVDALLAGGWHAGVLDISSAALSVVQERLGLAAIQVEWHCVDVRAFASPRAWDVWHDRAVYHFMTDEDSRRRYHSAVQHAVPSGGLVLATFAPDGPEKCSGLPVRRCSVEMLVEDFGDIFELQRSFRESHRTPMGAEQSFLWTMWRRRR